MYTTLKQQTISLDSPKMTINLTVIVVKQFPE